MTVRTGVEILRHEHYKMLAGQRVGLMTNPSAVDRELNSTYKIFSTTHDVNLTALFAPEHGFAGAARDAEQINTSTDPRTGVPVYSLYGETFRPTAEMLKDVDVLVCDIHDIGIRYYTYPWTVSYILEAAGEHGVRVVILDRPNPLGGVVIDGPQLESAQASFVARFRPHTFQPSQSKWAGETCYGVQVYRMEPARWRPIQAWLGVIITIRAMYPEHFGWLPIHPDSGTQHFDRLIGAAWIRRQIEADVETGKPTEAILAQLAVEWADDCRAFELERRPFLLYD